MEGGGRPMIGRDLIMRSEGQWEASKKTAPNGENTRTWRLYDQLGPKHWAYIPYLPNIIDLTGQKALKLKSLFDLTILNYWKMSPIKTDKVKAG